MLTQILEDKWEIYHGFVFLQISRMNPKNSQRSHIRRNLSQSIKSICIDSENLSWLVIKDIQHIHVLEENHVKTQDTCKCCKVHVSIRRYLRYKKSNFFAQ